MGIVVNVLLNLEGLVHTLEVDSDIYIKRLGSLSSGLVVLAIYGKLWVVGVLNPTALILLVSLGIDTLCYELLVQLLHQVELTLQINHRASLATLVNHKERGDTSLTCHECVIGTKRRRDVYDTRTVLYCNIVTQNHAESLVGSVLPIASLVQLNGLNPLNQLLVVHTLQFGACPATYNLEWDEFVARLVRVQRQALGLLVEVSVEQWLGQHSSNLLACVAVVRAYGNVINLWADAERSV